MGAPAALATIEGETALSDVAAVVARNYTIYHETAARLVALQEWVKGMDGMSW